jgi:hypothetical protein
MKELVKLFEIFDNDGIPLVFLDIPQAYAMVRSGDLPAIKIGGRGVWRVDRTKLDDYLDRLEQQTAAWAKANPLNAKEKQEPGE